jgi:hypothetical protein
MMFVLAIILIISFCCVIESLVYYIRNKKQANFGTSTFIHAVFGTLWVFMLLAGITLPTSGLIYMASLYYDANKKINQSLHRTIIASSFSILAFTVLVLFYTLIVRR